MYFIAMDVYILANRVAPQPPEWKDAVNKALGI